MRKLAIWAACAALSFATPAFAQPDIGGQPTDADEAPQIAQRVVVAELDSLPEPVRKQVNEAIARTSESDLQSLRQSLSTNPATLSALEAKGKHTTEVIAAAFDGDGSLLLVTTTAV